MEWEHPQKRSETLPDSLARLTGKGLSYPKPDHLKFFSQKTKEKKKAGKGEEILEEFWGKGK